MAFGFPFFCWASQFALSPKRCRDDFAMDRLDIIELVVRVLVGNPSDPPSQHQRSCSGVSPLFQGGSPHRSDHQETNDIRQSSRLHAKQRRQREVNERVVQRSLIMLASCGQSDLTKEAGYAQGLDV